MKIHPRTFVVQRASVEISGALLDLCEQHDLTTTEYLGILAEQMQRALKFALRAERHPDAPDRPAGVE